MPMAMVGVELWHLAYASWLGALPRVHLLPAGISGDSARTSGLLSS